MIVSARAALTALTTTAFAALSAACGAHAFGGDGRPALWDFSAVQAGGIAIVRPTYEGSKSYEVTGAPIFGPVSSDPSKSIVQFKGIDDLRFRLLNTAGFEAGPLVGYRFGREEDDDDRLQGLGDVDGGVVVGGYVGYRAGILFPFLSYHHQVSGDDAGAVLRFGAEARFEPVAGLRLTATGGATWADDDYMASFFGVTAAQSLGSGLTAFEADASIKDVFLDLAAIVPLGDRWSLRAGARYTHLIGDAADSPIVETESQWQGSLGVTYRFDLPRN